MNNSVNLYIEIILLCFKSYAKFSTIHAILSDIGYYDHVIELTKTAIAICDENDQDKTTLCFTLFSYHLKLGHYDKAYDAMVTNPDQSRRKDSLRQFVVTLFERKELKQLAFYPYVDMFEDLENIIESRARSVDLSVNNYYDFLYSFHISKENYRKGNMLMLINGYTKKNSFFFSCLRHV